MANSISPLSLVLFSLTIISQTNPTISQVAPTMSPAASPIPPASFPFSQRTPTKINFSNICQKTSNPEFCASLLKSAGATTDLKELAAFTLNLARTDAQKSQTLATSSAAAATDAQLKERYTSCSGNYNDAIGSIETAQKNLASGDFNGVNAVTSGIMTTVDNCQDSFEQPPMDTTSLLKDGKTMKDMCSIVLVLSNLLAKP